MAWIRIVTVEMCGEKFMDSRYILDADMKELIERLMDLMKDGERKGVLFSFWLTCFE